MKESLPAYIVNCFVAAGYDTLAVIADMDVTDSPGNSIEIIEDFINREFPNNQLYSRNGSKCNFPPGHRQRIKMFVENVQSRKEPKRKLRLPPSGIKSKIARITDGDSSASEISFASTCDQFSVMSDIRQQFAKWQRSQKNVRISGLKENNHFKINVKIVSGHIVVSIACKLCGKSPVLSIKNGKTLISNWTRHITNCIKSPLSKCTKTLDKYFSPSPRTSSSAGIISPPVTTSEYDSLSPLFASAVSDTPPMLSLEESVLDEEQIDVAQTSDQHFRIPPPVSEVQEGGLESVVAAHTDWSRATRHHLALLKCASDHNQSQISSFFQVSIFKVL